MALITHIDSVPAQISPAIFKHDDVMTDIRRPDIANSTNATWFVRVLASLPIGGTIKHPVSSELSKPIYLLFVGKFWKRISETVNFFFISLNAMPIL